MDGPAVFLGRLGSRRSRSPTRPSVISSPSPTRWPCPLLLSLHHDQHQQQERQKNHMTRRASGMGLVLVLVAVLCAGASAQSSGCTSALVSLSPCLNYITGNETTPSSSCCSQLTSVVGSEPQCLCMVLNGGASSLGITINQTQAMALPAACKVKTPPVSECSSAGEPSGSPSTPSVPSSDGGSKTLPTLETSGGSRAEVPSSIVHSLLFAVAVSLGVVCHILSLSDRKTSLHVC